jgi:GNAT superfamily N-acetyltransferase
VAEFTSRPAVLADVPALTMVMDAAISELQRGFLDDAEIASSRAIMGRGNQTPGRDSHLLDPTVHPARVRAMYTSPAFARRGVGRLILSLCEAAAAAEGFTRLELMSTLSGESLYTAYGFRPLERVADATGGAPVPLVRMEKPVDPSLLA